MEKSIESSLPVLMWLKVIILFTFGVTNTADSSCCVKKQSAFVGSTLQATKVLYQKMFQLKVLFDKMPSYLDRLIQHQTRLPLPMTWKRVSVFVRVVANKFKMQL